MPYNFGFTLFYQLYILSTLIFFIHTWGWITGIILTLLTVFQILFLLYARPILFLILRYYTKPEKFEICSSGMRIKYDRTAWIMQNMWSNLVPLYFILIITNLFIDKYLCGFNLFRIINLQNFIIGTIVCAIVGQITIFVFSVNKETM